jgi:predicted nucleotidyltransferase
MTPIAPTFAEALKSARALKAHLQKQGIPVEKVLLFGSTLTGKTHAWSDIDVAIIHRPFHASHFEERTAIRRARRTIDLRLETICFRPEDMERKTFALAQEVLKTGIVV